MKFINISLLLSLYHCSSKVRRSLQRTIAAAATVAAVTVAAATVANILYDRYTCRHVRRDVDRASAAIVGQPVPRKKKTPSKRRRHKCVGTARREPVQ